MGRVAFVCTGKNMIPETAHAFSFIKVLYFILVVLWSGEESGISTLGDHPVPSYQKLCSKTGEKPGNASWNLSWIRTTKIRFGQIPEMLGNHWKVIAGAKNVAEANP